ncbi:hypothetical protein D9758_008365 [Tetrapyrgos nigripes]|uniref:Uncharacterized protein n=1 Tax=Tetrapyrgos nigripes TaxID=182062 RepID=A0A8H5GDV3_9AGAR|nr:hypothetical protein D9758_008365 [Tetrapyrgos nigripes]
MMIPLSAIRVLRVAATITHSIALISTSYRLFYRLRRRRFSWDDGWAFMAFLADIFTLVTLWIFAYLNVNFRFARLSLASTLLSMLPKGRVRKASLLSIVLFTLFWASLYGWKVSVCEDDDDDYGSSLETTLYEFCDAGKVAGALEIVADTASCVCLILTGAYILWHMKLHSKERQMIVFMFSGTIFTAMAALARSYSILSTEDTLEAFTGHFEAAISLIVCNVVVVMAGIYGMLYQSRDSSEPPTDVERSPNEKGLHQVDRITHDTDSGTGRPSTLTFTEVDSFESPNSQAIHSDPSPSHSFSSHTRSPSPISVHSVSRSSERQHRSRAGDPNPRTSTSSSQEYYTESEPCSGSVIIILDTDSSGSELSV